jgi:hypothetical protein
MEGFGNKCIHQYFSFIPYLSLEFYISLFLAFMNEPLLNPTLVNYIKSNIQFK